MTKFNLTLADPDICYIDSLGKYICSNYGTRFNVNVYTRQEALEVFLADNPGKGTIVLVSPEFLSEEVVNAGVEIKIVLSGRKQDESINGYPCIFKYQPGDKIVKDLIALCSNLNFDIDLLVKGSNQTKVAAVFSPQGGSGKTTIAVSLAYQLGKLGMKVFYLNMESVSSTSYLMSPPENKYGMNEIIYHLKQNKRNLPVIIDKAINHDSRLNIDFFVSTGCSMELDELSDTDMEKLLSGLKSLGKYDLIVVDTQTGFNRYSIPVLCSSDALIIVILPDMTLKPKISMFSREMDRIAAGAEWGADCMKIYIINQRFAHDSVDSIELNGKDADIKIPHLKDIYELQKEVPVYNTEGGINIYTKKLAQHLAQKLALRSEGR